MQRTIFMVGMMLVCVSIVTAQDACPALVTTALEQVDEFCQAAERNQACYGNVSLTAEPQADAASFKFAQTGDIVDVSDIQTMTLAPMDEAADVWGVVLMRLQADIPDSLPGQNVTFLLFGDVQIENAVSPDDADYSPMQAFYLKTGIGDSNCEEAPESGVLVQTPDGVDEVTFNVNGVDVEVGSTVLLQAEPDSEMILSTVEGAAVMTLDGERYPAVAGTRLRIPIGADLRPSAPPGLPEAYGETNVRGLPVNALPRPIDIQPPLPDADLNILHERLNNGQPPCGVDGLPECVHALRPDASEHPWAQGDNWGEQLPPRPEHNPDRDLPLGGEQPDGSNLPRPVDGTPAGNNRPSGGNGTPAGNLPRPGGNDGTPVGNRPSGNNPVADNNPPPANQPPANLTGTGDQPPRDPPPPGDAPPNPPPGGGGPPPGGGSPPPGGGSPPPGGGSPPGG